MARSVVNTLRALVCGVGLVSLFTMLAPPTAEAQSGKLRIVSSDSQPIVYANVIVEGGAAQITDEKGEVSLGAGKRQTLTINVRRIGYTPFFGKVELSDTALVITIALVRAAQTLNEVKVTGRAKPSSPFIQGFYDRWMMRQKGLLSATFIGPEEIEFRHPDKITNMLNGLNGIELRRVGYGDMVAYSTDAHCKVAGVIDGQQQQPELIGNPPQRVVAIDKLLDANDVMAIEVYARGGNMPVSLQVQNSACGVIAFWTGSRKP
jgi:hypothetical protein